MRLRGFLVATAITLLSFWAQPLEAQSGTKIATDVTATGQTGAMQSGPRATQVTFTFCGTGFTGNVYVDAAATEAGLAQVYTSSPSGLNNCSVTYLSVPASRWYRVRWAASAGALNVWMLVSTTASAASYATMPAPTGCVAGSVAIFLGSPVALGCDAGLDYDPATDTLTATHLANDTLVRAGTGTATARVGGVLYVNTTPATTTGTAEQILMTYTLPANTLSANGKGIRIRVIGQHADNTNSVLLRIYRGGLAGTLMNAIVFNNADAAAVLSLDFIRTGAATAVFGGVNAYSTVSTTNAGAPAFDPTIANTFDVAATTGTAAGDVTVLAYIVEALN